MSIPFFSSIPETTPEFIRVGHGADVGYRALAVALLDNILAHPRIQVDLIKLLLHAHQHYKMQSTDSKTLIKPYDRMQALIQSLGISQWVLDFSWILRQMTVDALLSKRNEHLLLFVGRSGVVESPALLRLVSHDMGGRMMKVLAQSLGIPIEIRAYRDDVDVHQQLPHEVHYQSALMHPIVNPLVVLRHRLGCYEPLVHEKDKLMHIAELPLSANEMMAHEDDGVSTMIEQEISEMVLRHQKIRDEKLSVMVLAGEISSDFLMTQYIAALNVDELDVFCPWNAFKNKTTLHEPFHDALLDALALRLCLGRIEESQLFVSLDESSMSVS